ncbi:MAG: precorrin-6A reductase [Muribaculum sp.]|nr:precorrin-6A reductase [Muribaculum sp.]
MDGSFQKIVIFAGTTEGRKLSECLAQAQIPHTVCVATEYGEIVLKRHPLADVRQGRMNREEMERFLKDGAFAVVADATHPFAEDVTRNLKAAVETLERQGIPVLYLRLKRDGGAERESGVRYFESNEDCAAALEHTEGNILLTTGSRELARYCALEAVRQRLYVRVLPGMESLSLCMEQGICGRQVIAMQGPFSVEMNEALIRQYRISCLVTKESGVSGGYPEKVEAARRTGIRLLVIGRPPEEQGESFAGICERLEELYGRPIRCGSRHQMEITLAGAGMGSEGCLTKEAEQAAAGADILLGAERLLENRRPALEKRAYYQARQVIPYLREIQDKYWFRDDLKTVVLFSGDSGFYSGCGALQEALQEEIGAGRLRASLRILPGISSVSYLAAKLGESYQDAAVCSIHGKKPQDLVRRIRNSPKTFLLTSGLRDVHLIGSLLAEYDMPECEVVLGYQLSYEEERIESHTPRECLALREEGLYTCLVKNPCAAERRLTHGRKDEEFIRGGIPMSKEEVREVSICKLRLCEGAVVYDIGSGTGSIAAEIAALDGGVRVYAVERKEEAVSLIRRNAQKFGLQNLTAVEAEAPEGLLALPAATHAFIGGSGGRMKEILQTLWQINPKMRIVANAVSTETLCELQTFLSSGGICREESMEMVQLQVSRAQKAGSHHLMRAENPVWICAFDMSPDADTGEGMGKGTGEGAGKGMEKGTVGQHE